MNVYNIAGRCCNTHVCGCSGSSPSVTVSPWMSLKHFWQKVYLSETTPYAFRLYSERPCSGGDVKRACTGTLCAGKDVRGQGEKKLVSNENIKGVNSQTVGGTHDRLTYCPNHTHLKYSLYY